MAGRPRKKPEYNPELQFNNFLQELRDAYEEADSLRSLADELNISLLKLRKLLITADVFTSDICIEINDLHQSGKKIPEIMKLTGLSRASVHSYLPYTKGIYNAAEISLNAERCRTYKNRQEQIRLLKEIPSEENLWQTIIAFQNYPFKTATGLPFRYKLKVGKNGEYNRELLIDRREKSKSLAWSSVVLAFENVDGVDLQIDQLSGGYKAVLSVIADIAKRLSMANPDSQNPLEEDAVILIDELDLHLHPKWQKEIVDDLKRTFPNCQFIVSTHSPFVIQSLNAEELFDIKTMQYAEEEGSYKGWSIEAIQEHKMGVEPKISIFNQYLEEFSSAMDDENYEKAKTLYKELKEMVSPGSHESKILKLDMEMIEADDKA